MPEHLKLLVLAEIFQVSAIKTEQLPRSFERQVILTYMSDHIT